MASLMENLIDIYNRECSAYEELLEISQRKTPIIASGNLENLQKITDEEQDMVNRLGSLERERREVTADIANVLNRDVETLKSTLAGIHDRLCRTMRELKRVNEQNGELLRDALEMVEFEIAMPQAAKAAPQTANYNRGACSAGETMGVNRGFDAKQ